MFNISNGSTRAIDRVFDRMGQLHRGSPLAAIDSMFDRWEDNIRLASQPEDGIYTVYEMNPVTYQIETNERGDIIHRRLSDSEIEAIKTNKEIDSE